MKWKITPKFDVNKIVSDTIEKDWFEFQLSIFKIGQRMSSYMKNYIDSHVRRRSNTGNLAKNIKTNYKDEPGRVFVGIGDIGHLNKTAKYWYVVNFGKTTSGESFIPNRGGFVPGSFEGGEPIPGAQGVQHFNYKDGSKMGIKPRNPIRPMNYIEATEFRTDLEIERILNTSKGK